MHLTLLRESRAGERRVAAPPGVVESLCEVGWNVCVESGAGERAGFPDELYRAAGAEICEGPREALRETDVVLKIHPPAERRTDDGATVREVEIAPASSVWIALFQDRGADALEQIERTGASAFALERVPRTTRAQSVDVLSSMAGLAGYRAVIEAAAAYERVVGARTTAAGSTPPADMLVIGAGVAGLAAVATGRDLGARVRAFDVRPAVREEVESLGADFLMLDLPLEEGRGGYAAEMDDDFLAAERDLFSEEVPESDLVVTTAAIPGRAAPKLVTDSMVRQMRPGSVIVDLAAESGGNCELTEAGDAVQRHGVHIIGYTDLPSRVASHASEFFGRNLLALLRLLGPPEEFEIDTDDELVRAMLAVHSGEALDPISVEPSDGGGADDHPDESAPEQADDDSDDRRVLKAAAGGGALALAACIGAFAPASFVQHLTVFVLACFVGWRVIWDVTSSLHTPLMSVTNAISGIVILGGILQVTLQAGPWARWLGAGAMLVASINIFGGFAVTQRMLGMFRAEDDSA